MAKRVRKWSKIVPGQLYGWKKTHADSTRRAILDKAVKKDGYATIVRRLNQTRNVTKDRETEKLMEKDMAYLKKKYRKEK